MIDFHVHAGSDRERTGLAVGRRLKQDPPRISRFSWAGMMLIKRLTLIARASVIEKVFYPVFPPDRNAEGILTWLRAAAFRGEL